MHNFKKRKKIYIYIEPPVTEKQYIYRVPIPYNIKLYWVTRYTIKTTNIIGISSFLRFDKIWLATLDNMTYIGIV